MRILRHYLDSAERKPSPNKGGELHPLYIVIHYTATPSAQSAIGWLTDKRARASAHLVVSQSGDITQLVPFNRVAWHAGRSSWDGLSGLNSHSIGIELENPGRLTKDAYGQWRAWFGQSYPAAEILIATHRHETTAAGWPLYPPLQLLAAAEAAMVIANAYPIRDVLGHDDISPGRKVDPGPAFPMESFRARVLGRGEDDTIVYRPTTSLNIRKGPGATWDTVAPALTSAARLVVLEEAGAWRRVRVQGDDLEGWVHGHYLARA